MGDLTVPARKLLALEILFFVLASTAVVLRYVASRSRRRSIQLHDLFCVLSWVGENIAPFSINLLTPSEVQFPRV